MLKNNDSPLFQRRRPSHSLLKEDDGNKQSILLNNKKFNEKTPLLPHLTSHLRTATNSDGHEDNHNHQHSLSKIFSTATTPSPSTPTKSFTRSQVRNLARNNPEQVWVIYQDLVLNLTKWIKYHPGGDLPLRHLSGHDATDQILAFHPDEVITKRLPRFAVGKLVSPSSSFDTTTAAAAATATAASTTTTTPPSSANHLDSESISTSWRDLHFKLIQKGLYKTDFKFYARELVKDILLFFTAIYLATCIPDASLLTYSVSACFMAAFWHQISFVAHDAGHSGITHDHFTDRVIGMVIANVFGGLSIEWWKASHYVHHILTNHAEHDPDIQLLPFFAVSEKLFRDIYSTFHNEALSVSSSPLSQFLISIQHLTYYVILFFGRFNLYAQSYIHLFKAWQRRHQQASCSWTPVAIACCGVFWAWYGCLLSQLPNLSTTIVYLVLSNGLTSILHVQITLSHWAMPCDDHKLIADTDDDNDKDKQESEEVFAVRNLRTTMDVDCPVWMDWFHGGLQYQVTHHLYPRLPRHNLRLVRGMVEQEICAKHGLVYHHHKFVAANKIVLGSLYDAATQLGVYMAALKDMAEKARVASVSDGISTGGK